MLEIKQHTKVKKSSEKSFGFVFSVFFTCLSFLPLIFSKNINLVFLFIAIVLLIITFIYPKIYHYPNLIWLKIGEILSLIISPIIMLLIFILAFTTTKFFLVLFRKKLLDDKIDSKVDSYWIKYEKNKGTVEDQY
ncbi:MAG: hypothetical protein CMN79_02280 [Spirochaetales bacterium]|nr:hypothetical protein [Spirochaetales bacterium]